MYQRYFWRGSGASMGGPRPPPGRFSPAAGWPCAPPPSTRCSSIPSPEILKAKDWPGVVVDATSVLESGWLGLSMDLKLVLGAGENSMDLGRMATKCCKG